jgi:hypothetical protein
MSQDAQNLIILGAATLFLGTFFGLWMVAVPESNDPSKPAPAVRFRRRTNTPVLCGKHISETIVKPGKMAVLDNKDCQICKKQSNTGR